MSTLLQQRLAAAVELQRAEYTALLVDLVRYPSTLGDERPAQERLLEHVRDMGDGGGAMGPGPGHLVPGPTLRAGRAGLPRPAPT